MKKRLMKKILCPPSYKLNYTFDMTIKAREIATSKGYGYLIGKNHESGWFILDMKGVSRVGK